MNTTILAVLEVLFMVAIVAGCTLIMWQLGVIAFGILGLIWARNAVTV